MTTFPGIDDLVEIEHGIDRVKKASEKRIYLLERKSTTHYDEAEGFVVIAKDSMEARNLAAGAAGISDNYTWLNAKLSTCKVLHPTGKSRVILRDFRAG